MRINSITQVTVVVPSVYSQDSQWMSYTVHMAVGAFFLVNLIGMECRNTISLMQFRSSFLYVIAGNWLGLWLTDTSTRFIVLPSVIKVRLFLF